MPSYLWDYDKKELEKTEKERIFILERMINYGPGDEKIKLSKIKHNWNQLHLEPRKKRLMESLIWNK